MWKRMTVIDWLIVLAIAAILIGLLVPPSWFPKQEQQPLPDDVRIIAPCGPEAEP